MSGEVPVCDILLEAAEYLSTLGSNLRARSQNLRDKRISKDKLRNTHAVVKAADKLLLICDLSKKSLENVETGIKRILNVCGANTSSKSHTSSKTSKSGAEFQYFRHGLRKLKISKNVPIERYTSAKVAVAKLASAILDNHPIYYDCKLYRRRKAAENKEKERGNKPISLESDDNDTQKSEDCSAKKKSNIRVNNIVKSSDDEIKPKNSTHSDSSDKESEEKSKHSQSKNDSPKEKAKDKGETASKKRKKIILSDSDSESNLSTVKDPKEKCKVTDLDGNESSLPKESKVNSINTTDDDDKSSKKTGEKKENSEDDQNGKTSSFDDDIKTSVAKASKEDSRNESDADEIKSSDDEIKSFTTEASKKNNKKDSDNYSSDNEIKSPSPNAVQKNSKKESDDDDNKCSDDGIKSKSKAFKKNSKNYSNIDDNNDSDHEIASSSPKAASENDSNVDDNKRSDDEIIHSIPMVSKEGKSKNNLDGKENSSEEEGRSIDPVSEKPLLKCIDITKLLKPDIADKKQKVEKEKKVRFCIDLSSPSKKTPNNKKDIELEKRLEEKRKEEKYWEEKREAVKAFQPKSFKIMLTKFPDFTNDFLDSNNIQKIIQNGKVIAEKEIETCDSEICIDNNDEGNKQGKIIVEPEANPVAPIEVLKAKSALLDDSGSEHSNPSTCALNETGDINPIIQETDKAGENNVKTKKRKRLVSSDYDDKKSTNKDDISPDYKKDKSHSDDTPSTPKPKRKRSDSTTPQSKSKHIRESMHAKKMLLTYSSSETEDEELKNALREIKDSLLSQDDDEKEIESVKDQVIKAHKKKLIYSSSEDEKEETAKEKTKEDDLNEENHIEVSLKESSLTPSNENSNKVSHDDNLSPSEDNIFTQGSLKESSPELSSTNVDEHSSSSSKMGRSRGKPTGSGSQNSDSPDTDKDIDGLTNLKSLNKPSRARRDSNSGSNSTDTTKTRSSRRNMLKAPAIKTEDILEAHSSSSEASAAEDGEAEELPPVNISGLNGGGVIDHLAKEDLLDESGTSSSQHSEKNNSDDSNNDSDDEENVKSKRRKANTISSDSDGGARTSRRKKDPDASDFEATATSDDDDDLTSKRSKRKKKVTDSDASGGSSNEGKKKRRRIKAVTDSDASGSGSENEGKKHGRKNIRKVMGKNQLEEATKKAAREEKERIARITERQKLYNNLQFDESGKPDEVVLDKVVLDFDPETKEPLIEVDRGLVKKLKPHQANGIKFMWDACFESVKRIKKDRGSGCILAHCMGLGKTLQVVSLTHTLLIHRKLTGVNRVLVVCPLSTVLNWVNEFNMWLKHADNDYEVDVYELSRLSGVRRSFSSSERDEESRTTPTPGHQRAALAARRALLLGITSQSSRRPSPELSPPRNIYRPAVPEPPVTAARDAILVHRTPRGSLLAGRRVPSFVTPGGTLRVVNNQRVSPPRHKQNSERAFQLQQWFDGGGVCVLGYEMFRNLSADNPKKFRKKMLKSFQESLVDPGPDLVVCDEGHLLKNEKTSLSQSMNRVRTLRRIVLTGTPLQNNLKEYYCMVTFVKPNLLGKYNEYLNRFVNPITNGQYTDSTEHDIRIMKRRSHVLHKMLDGAVQRRDYGVLAPFLPPKHEFVLFISLTDVQIKLYQHYLDNYSRRPLPGKSSGFLFPDFQSLQRIWTHPLVLKYNSERYEILQQKKRDKEEEEDSEGSLINFIDDDSTGEETSSDDSIDDLSDLSDDSHRKSKKKSPKKKAKEAKEASAAARRRGTRANPTEHDDLDGPGLDIEEIKHENPTEWWIKLVEEGELEDIKNSNKLVLLFDILRQCEAIGDKLLVFSQSLYSLDLIEHFLGKVDEATQEGRIDDKLAGHVGSWSPGVDYFRLDGSTSCENRSIWCKNFNREDNPRARLFLISTRAGGLGINLVAANRVIIFDVSWNPSHDVQSIFRVYRFGQKKPCYIYRFLAMGTMEEKIYERQVTKQAISKRVIDEQQIDRHYAENDLAELYTFEAVPSEARQLPPLPKDRLFAELLKDHDKLIFKYHEHDSLLENKEEETLTEEERKAAWEDFENEKNRPPPAPFPNVWPMHNGMAPGLLAQQQQQMAYAALATMLRKDMPNLNENQLRDMLPLIYNANPALMQKMGEIYKYAAQPGMMNAGMMNPALAAAVGSGGMGGSSGLQYEPPWQRQQQQQQQMRLQQLLQQQQTQMGAQKYYAGGLGSRDPVAMQLQQQQARAIMLGEAARGRPRGRPPLSPRAPPAPLPAGDVVDLDSD